MWLYVSIRLAVSFVFYQFTVTVCMCHTELKGYLLTYLLT